MRRSSSILIALASLCLAGAANGETHPHYGGTLHVAVQELPQALDPVLLNSDAPALHSLSQLVFENLVTLDDRGAPQPALASGWQVEPGNRRWRFQVRPGVIFSDGTPLDATVAAAAVRAGNPQWKVFALGDLVMIETNAPDPNVTAELALARNSIVRRENGALLGTGPFVISKWDATTKQATLVANDQYWNGRPFIDAIEVDLGKSYRDQVMALDLGKSDLIEIAPEEIRPAQTGNRAVISSLPEDLMCLVFARDPQSEVELRTRGILSQSIDRAALNNVVFQTGGEPTAAVLPNWLSGYGFLFLPNAGTARARVTPPQTSWTLSFDAADPIEKIVADRILLNAREVGITMQISNSGNADIRLVRQSLPSLDPQIALSELARELQLPNSQSNAPSVSDLLASERALLDSHRIIPLLHLRSAIAARPNVHEIKVRGDGVWGIRDVWLSPEAP